MRNGSARNPSMASRVAWLENFDIPNKLSNCSYSLSEEYDEKINSETHYAVESLLQTTFLEKSRIIATFVW